MNKKELNDIVREYGCDTLRTYEMFMGDYEQEVPWNTDSLRGCKRFIDKVIKLKDKINDKEGFTSSLETIQHQTIKKVEQDLDNMAYNTAVSALMILSNAYSDADSITKEDYGLLLTLLNPIAPHVTEELNEQIGFKPICESTWPVYDEEKTKENTFTLVVQVNGKVRGKIETSSDTSKEELEKLAISLENVNKFIEGKTIVKTIVIPNKIVNIVVKD